MGSVAAAQQTGRVTGAKRSASAGAAGFASADEFRDVLDRALRQLDEDDRAGSLLRATGLRMRFSFPDVDLEFNVAASEQESHHLSWSFEPVGWAPKLELTMDSNVANGYLQGKESLAIAIARGRVRCSGEARTALLYVPAVRLIVGPYRGIIRADYPHLVID